MQTTGYLLFPAVSLECFTTCVVVVKMPSKHWTKGNKSSKTVQKKSNLCTMYMRINENLM